MIKFIINNFLFSLSFLVLVSWYKKNRQYATKSYLCVTRANRFVATKCMRLTKITSGKNTLHWVLCGMLVGGSARFIACSAQIVVDANQTFVSSSSEVIFQTRITADSWKDVNTIYTITIRTFTWTTNSHFSEEFQSSITQIN